MATSLTLGTIATLTGGELRGDAELTIGAVATLDEARVGDLTWVVSSKYAAGLKSTAASAALIGPDIECALPAVVCRKPELAISAVLAELQPPLPHPPAGRHPTAVVAADADVATDAAIGPHVVIQSGAVIGPRCTLHAGVFVGAHTRIGADAVLWPNVVVRERCTVGARVTIHPNATIGADGFGFNVVDGRFVKIPQIGTVVIGDDVEIGAGTCIDRAKCGATLIGDGCKLDNLTQVGHNVRLGAHCCLAAQAGVAGSSTLGHHVMFGGKVGVRDHVHIGDAVQVAGCSCVGNDIADGEIVVGTPAKPKADFFRELAAHQRLPKTTRLVKELLKRVERLEAANNPETC